MIKIFIYLKEVIGSGILWSWGWRKEIVYKDF